MKENNNLNNKKYLFEEMKVSKALATMAVPTVISQLINLIYNMVDAIFIGQTGDTYKAAAVTLAYTIFLMTTAFSNLFGIGGGSLVARLLGVGKTNKAKGASSLSFYGSIVIAILYSILIFIFMEPLLYFLGASENTILFAKQYLFVVTVIGTFPVVLSQTLSHLIRHVGYSKEASIGLSMGGILNCILDPIFMFILLPKGYEVLGAAIATLISNIISLVYLFIKYLSIKKESALSMNINDIKYLEKNDIKSLFGVGVPSALLPGLFDLANIVLNALMSSYGDIQLAAIGIVMKIERLPNAINIGISQGMLPIVAYNYASENHKRMNDILNTAKKVGLMIAFVSLILYQIFANPLSKIFLNVNMGSNKEIALQTIFYASLFLRIRCFASPVQFLNYNTSYCMQAVDYGKGTLLHVIFRELVFYIPYMFIFNYLFGIYGLVIAIFFGEGSGAIFATLIFRHWKKENINIKKYIY